MTPSATGRTVIELSEYQRARVTVADPTNEDLRLADRLTGDGHDPRLAVRWLANGDIDITASSWVGVVRFSSLDIYVVPKLVGGALRVLRMLEYAAGVSMLLRLPADRELPAKGRDLFDLICLLLAQETEALVRDGLLRDYRATDDTLEVLRGRLRYRDQYLRRFGRLDRLECHYDEYNSDTPDNQLVAAGLTVARRRANDPAIRFALGRLAGLFAEACQPVSTDADWYEATIRYDRRNHRYRPAHELAKLVLRCLAFDDLYATDGTNVTAFLLDMNAVFERFATRLVHDALAPTPLRASGQHRIRAVIRDDRTERTYSAITPDLVIEDATNGRTVPIDIKYKTYDARKIATADIYQTFLYAYSLGTEPDERRAGILYPSAEPSPGARLSIKPVTGPTAARITAAGIDVPAVLDALTGHNRDEMLDEMRRTVAAITGLSTTALAPV